MNKLFMGIDVGAVSAKGVIIDEYDNIIASSYLYTEGDPIETTKEVIINMENDIDLANYEVVSIGTTGSAKKLIGRLLDASVIKNEITTHAVGTIKLYPDVKTILEIGGEDSKITIVGNGTITDYAVNTSCMAGAGLFIDSLARQLNVEIGEVANMALCSKNEVEIATKCSVFLESELINKMQMGYKKEDILAGVCRTVAINYVNNVARGKKIQMPVVFNGGVSKNMAIVYALENILKEKIIVNKNSHLMGAFGVAIMARESKKEKKFNFDVDSLKLETKIINCVKCNNKCEIVTIYKNNTLVDYWGGRCGKANEIKI